MIMSHSAVSTLSPIHVSSSKVSESAPDGYLLDRDLNTALQYVVGSKGNYITLESGRKIFDASGGAAVACLGHGNEEVNEMIRRQVEQISYCHSMFFRTRSTESLAEELILSTGKKLDRVFLISSGMFFKTHYRDGRLKIVLT